MQKSFGTLSFLDLELKVKMINLIHEFEENQQTLMFFLTFMQSVHQNRKPEWFSVSEIEHNYADFENIITLILKLSNVKFSPVYKTFVVGNYFKLKYSFTFGD